MTSLIPLNLFRIKEDQPINQVYKGLPKRYLKGFWRDIQIGVNDINISVNQDGHTC